MKSVHNLLYVYLMQRSSEYITALTEDRINLANSESFHRNLNGAIVLICEALRLELVSLEDFSLVLVIMHYSIYIYLNSSL